eukprot:COSAG03_NODE_483_length_7559_cov_2.993432_8_plen_77_part_00
MADALPEALRGDWEQTVAAGPPPSSLTRADCIADNAAWCDLTHDAGGLCPLLPAFLPARRPCLWARDVWITVYMGG